MLNPVAEVDASLKGLQHDLCTDHDLETTEEQKPSLECGCMSHDATTGVTLGVY